MGGAGQAGTSWKGTRVLVVGGHSFLGAHLARALIDHGAQVHATTHSVATAGSLKEYGLSHLLTDVTRIDWAGEWDAEASLLTILEDVRPSVVFNCVGLVNALTSDVRGSLLANTIAAWNVCQAVGQMKEPRAALVHSSTDKVYGECHDADESAPIQAGGIYQTTKVCGDLLAHMLLDELTIPGAVIRSTNFYGPYDWHVERLIPHCILACLSGTELSFRSDGSNVRDYVYIGDAVDLFLAVAKRALCDDLDSRTYNISCGNAQSVRDVAHAVRSLTGSTTEMSFAQSQIGELAFQSVDSSRAQKEFGWLPQTSLQQGLTQSIDSYRGY